MLIIFISSNIHSSHKVAAVHYFFLFNTVGPYSFLKIFLPYFSLTPPSPFSTFQLQSLNIIL